MGEYELTGCQLCSSDAVFDADDFIDGRWRIFCTFCGYGIEGDDADALVAEWNNREAPSALPHNEPLGVTKRIDSGAQHAMDFAARRLMERFRGLPDNAFDHLRMPGDADR